MNILSYLMNLGTIYLILELLWRILGFIVVTWVKMGWLNYNKMIYLTLLSARSIIISVTTTLMTIHTIQLDYYGEKSWEIFVIAGGIALFLANIQFLYSRQAISYGIDKPMERNHGILIASILLYSLLMRISSITINLLSYNIMAIIKWLYGVNYLRNLLNIAGGLFLVWIVYSGVIITVALVSILIQKLSTRGEA